MIVMVSYVPDRDSQAHDCDGIVCSRQREIASYYGIAFSRHRERERERARLRTVVASYIPERARPPTMTASRFLDTER